MKLEHLKIKYVFIEGRNPNKDLENTLDTLANDVFVDEFYEHILPKIIRKKPENHTGTADCG